jgi:choline dehydrogenase
MATPGPEFDYIVIGSGAGGGPVAANLARAGHRVALIEAGQAPEPDAYTVPAFHGFASEDPDLSWQFFVRHYASAERSRRDWKFREEHDGVFYPRAGTLGGCTAHHAMITVYPHAGDWDHIAEITGDASWRADRMRAYFERLEDCGYVDRVAPGAPNPTRHGWGGWLRTTGPATPPS